MGKEELSLNELTPELMVKFEEWLNTKGRKQSTTRLYLYQISSVYNIAVKEGIVPKLKLLKGVRVALPAKKERELLEQYQCHAYYNVIRKFKRESGRNSEKKVWMTYGENLSVINKY